MMWYLTDGRSLTLPPRTSTTECSWRLWPIPGMYAVTSIWFVSRTRAILRRAEFGFLGVIVRTWRQTPRFCGAPGIGTCRWRRLFQFLRIAGALIFWILGLRPRRTSWLIVGTKTLSFRLVTQWWSFSTGSPPPWSSIGRSADRLVERRQAQGGTWSGGFQGLLDAHVEGSPPEATNADGTEIGAIVSNG